MDMKERRQECKNIFGIIFPQNLVQSQVFGPGYNKIKTIIVR